MDDRSKKYRVIKEYKSPYPIPIIFREGDQVDIGNKFTDDPDWENWVWCKGKNGKQAWAPVQYLTIDADVVVFLRNYNALELSVSAGEELAVYEEINGFGMAEKADGEKGWVPLRNMVEEKTIG